MEDASACDNQTMISFAPLLLRRKNVSEEETPMAKKMKKMMNDGAKKK